MQAIIIVLFICFTQHIHGKEIIVPIGNSDAYTRIQQAFNDTATNGGGSVILDQGTYLVSMNVEMYSNTALKGAGMDKSIIKLMDYAPTFGNRAGLLRADYRSQGGCDNIVIQDMTLDGNKFNQDPQEMNFGRFGLFTEVCNNLVIERVKIINMQGYGFDPHGFKPSTFAVNLRMKDCISHSNDWDGFTIDQSTNVVIENSVAYDNGRHGFNLVTGTHKAVLTNITAYNNGFSFTKTNATGCGVTFQDNNDYGTHHIALQNSNIYNNNKAGVCTTGTVHDINITSTQIMHKDKCILLGEGARNITVDSVKCQSEILVLPERNVKNVRKIRNTLNNPSTASGTSSILAYVYIWFTYLTLAILFS